MRILVLGAGSAGQRHIKNLIALGETDIWVYDADTRCAEKAAELGAKVVYHEMHQGQLKPDAVLVCTPPKLHTMWAATALGGGAHVFVEKPFSDEWRGVDVLLDLAEKAQKWIMVGYQLRFHKGFLNARHHWDELGYIETITATYSQALDTWRPGTDYRQNYLMTLDGGIILEQSHEIDYCRWLAGEVETVECKAQNTGRWGMASYDVADIVMYHKSGTESRIHLDCTGQAITPGFRTPHYRRDCDIKGTEGWLVWAYDGYWLISSCDRQIKRRAGAGFDMGARAYMDEMAHFLKCCKGEAKPSVDGREGARVLALALACVESAKENGRRLDV